MARPISQYCPSQVCGSLGRLNGLADWKNIRRTATESTFPIAEKNITWTNFPACSLYKLSKESSIPRTVSFVAPKKIPYQKYDKRSSLLLYLALHAEVARAPFFPQLPPQSSPHLILAREYFLLGTSGVNKIWSAYNSYLRQLFYYERLIQLPIHPTQ